MAYDTTLESRIDEVVESWGIEVTKRKMFGGLGYFINRNMCCGIAGNELIIKTDRDTADKVLQKDGVRPFHVGGRGMKAWQLVAQDVLDEVNLERLLSLCREYVLTLPPK